MTCPPDDIIGTGNVTQFDRIVSFTVAYPFKSDVITTLPYNCSNEPTPFVYHRVLRKNHCDAAYFILAAAAISVRFH